MVPTRLVLLLEACSLQAFYSLLSGLPSLVQAYSQAAFRYSHDISALTVFFLSSYHLLGAHVLSRPTDDLRKVLSRDPDHNVHHFFLLSYSNERYSQRDQGYRAAEGTGKKS